MPKSFSCRFMNSPAFWGCSAHGVYRFHALSIKALLIDVINESNEMSDGPVDKAMTRWKKIEKFQETHLYTMYANVKNLCDVTTRC